MNCHPKYGKVTFREWKPLYYHKTSKKTGEIEFGRNPKYEIMFMDNKELPYIIRNKKLGNIVNSYKGQYTLSNNKKERHTYQEIHLALASAFPSVTPKKTVDHIDNNHKNNHIFNLMWMSLSENSKKGQKKSVKSASINGGRNGKFIVMKKPIANAEKSRKNTESIGTFKSIEKCSRYIIENVIDKDKKPKQKTVASKIRRSINSYKNTAYGYYFDKVVFHIADEEWKQHPFNKKCSVSTHGRVKNAHGDISQQKKMRYGGKYKQVGFNKSNTYVHKLVWETWVGKIPKHLDIMHDDTAPLNPDGTYRNWLCDLSLGTRSENMKSFHKFYNTEKNIVHSDKFVEEIPDTSLLIEKKQYPDNELGKLMKNRPKGIHYSPQNKRGSYYTLCKRFSKTDKEFRSTSKKSVSDKNKFLEILKIYQENCKNEKQDKNIMNIDINNLKKYI